MQLLFNLFFSPPFDIFFGAGMVAGLGLINLKR
jgi:hypothetical protein